MGMPVARDKYGNIIGTYRRDGSIKPSKYYQRQAAMGMTPNIKGPKSVRDALLGKTAARKSSSDRALGRKVESELSKMVAITRQEMRGGGMAADLPKMLANKKAYEARYNAARAGGAGPMTAGLAGIGHSRIHGGDAGGGEVEVASHTRGGHAVEGYSRKKPSR